MHLLKKQEKVNPKEYFLNRNNLRSEKSIENSLSNNSANKGLKASMKA